MSWTVREGVRSCLLGPNGAGKSTSIRLLEGALSPTAGRVELLGARPGTGAYMEARLRVGIVPQQPGMYGDVTVREYLELVRRLYRLERLGAIVQALGLDEFLERRMDKLSGGFQRRLVLAAALACNPELLLLDEPTAGLDPLATHQVHELLRTEMKGRTTLLCTHNLDEAQALCEEVVILRAGRVVVSGDIGSLRRSAGPRLRLAARQGIEPLLAAVGQGGIVDGTVEVPVTDPEADAPALLRRLLEQGLDVYLCEPVEASLEDVFIEAVT